MNNTNNINNVNQLVDLEECRAMVMLPIDAIEIEINATIYRDNNLFNVSKTLNNRNLQKAFRDAETNYTEDDDEFILTNKGLSWLYGLQNKKEKFQEENQEKNE